MVYGMNAHSDRMNKIPIRSRVHTPDGWGWVRWRSGDLYEVLLDSGIIANYGAQVLRPETFRESLFCRPGMVGGWGKVEFWGLQAALLIALIIALSNTDGLGVVFVIMIVCIEAMTYMGLRSNFEKDSSR